MTALDLPISGPPVRGRSCGGCTACCTQLPVDLPSGRKPANERCPKLRSTGCGIYPTRPAPCRYWNCRWLIDEDTHELLRPDKSGVVIDVMPDEVVIDGRVGHALQLWVDPKRPEAHRDPALRRYLSGVAVRFGIPALVRWSSSEGLSLFAPELTGRLDWVEQPGELQTAEFMKERIAALKQDHQPGS